jgi:hypothetical protein
MQEEPPGDSTPMSAEEFDQPIAQAWNRAPEPYQSGKRSDR